MRTLRLLLLMVLLPMLTAGARDPGLLLELDRESYSLTARDLLHGVDGPTMKVVMANVP